MNELRYSIRQMLKNPGLTSVIVLTLAIGIGANTAIFSVVNAVLLRPLPYEQADRLVTLWDRNETQGYNHTGPSPGNFLDWRKRNQVFEGMTAWYKSSQTLRDHEEAEQVASARVSVDFFEVLKTRPALGRVFLPADTAGGSFNVASQYTGGDRVVVISDNLWRRRYAADPEMIGRKITLDNEPWEVIGVLPADFALPGSEIGLWIPWDINLSYQGKRFPEGPPRDYRFLRVLARLKGGVSLDQAQSQMQTLASELADEFPKTNKGWSARLIPLYEEIVGSSRPTLLVLFGAVGFVLLIACANVASLLLARAAARRRETAVLLALGASRARLIRQFLTESMTLALTGAAVGVALTYLGLKVILSLAPSDVPRINEASIDLRVLAFTAAVAILTGTAFGIVPALQGARADLSASLKDAGSRGATAGRSHNRLRAALVTGEIAIALVLLAGAALFARSFARVVSVDAGFDGKNLLVARIFLNNGSYRSGERASVYYRGLIERLRGLPSVESVAAVTALPMSDVGMDFDRPCWREGETVTEGEVREVNIRMATPLYFTTLGISLLRGRAIEERDGMNDLRVIVINEALARREWAEENPIGKRLVIDYLGGKYLYEVIGVVADVRYYGPKSKAQPEVFIPHAQNPYLAMNVVIKTSADAAQLTIAVRREVIALDPAQPVHSITTMEQLIAKWVAPDRFSMTLLGALALIALMLAATGVYATQTYTVSRRTHEIGVRMALGARPVDVIRLVMGQSLKLTLAGSCLGLAASIALARVVASMLYDVSAYDTMTFLSALSILSIAVMIAGYIPARRATRISPLIALRHE